MFGTVSGINERCVYGMAMFFLSEFDEGMTLLDSCRLEPWHCYDVIARDEMKR